MQPLCRGKMDGVSLLNRIGGSEIALRDSRLRKAGRASERSSG
jgi:hypothetical protein